MRALKTEVTTGLSHLPKLRSNNLLPGIFSDQKMCYDFVFLGKCRSNLSDLSLTKCEKGCGRGAAAKSTGVVWCPSRVLFEYLKILVLFLFKLTMSWFVNEWKCIVVDIHIRKMCVCIQVNNWCFCSSVFFAWTEETQVWVGFFLFESGLHSCCIHQVRAGLTFCPLSTGAGWAQRNMGSDVVANVPAFLFRTPFSGKVSHLTSLFG